MSSFTLNAFIQSHMEIMGTGVLVHSTILKMLPYFMQADEHCLSFLPPWNCTDCKRCQQERPNSSFACGQRALSRPSKIQCRENIYWNPTRSTANPPCWSVAEHTTKVTSRFFMAQRSCRCSVRATMCFRSHGAHFCYENVFLSAI